MNFFIEIFYVILYQPLLNILVWLYNFLPGHDLGLALIILTVAIRLVLHPLSVKSIASQKSLQELQPKIEKLQKELKDKKEEQAKAMLELYQKEKINPFSGCLMVLLQLPFLVTLYYVALNSLKPEVLHNDLYSFTSDPGAIKPTLFWLLDLHNKIVIGVMAGASGLLQFLQTKISMAYTKPSGMGQAGDMAKMMQKQMVYFFPLISVLMVWQLGGLVGVYWTVSSLFALLEQRIIYNKSKTTKIS
jgi:YidC/Oxa1 family membrane protein insertase